jgi:hypothetical protein
MWSCLNTLKHEDEEDRRESRWGLVRDTSFYGGDRKSTGFECFQAVPARPSGRAGWREELKRQEVKKVR